MSRSNGRWKEKEKGLISLQVAPPALSAGASERCLLIGGVDYLYTAILDRLVAALLNGSMLAAMGPESVFERPPDRAVAGAIDDAELHDLVLQ